MAQKNQQNLELLQKKTIVRYLSDKNRSFRDKIVILQRIPSTNTYLAERLKKNGDDGVAICLAEGQTAGKGRLEREWLSPYGRNIYLSLSWNFAKDFSALSGLSLAAAVGVTAALKKYGIDHGVGLKWPNDVLWQNRKLAGILIEVFGSENSSYDAIVGVGLNVVMPKKIGAKIEQPWCDIAEIIGDIPQRNKIAGFLLDQLLTTMNIFQKKGLKPFIKKWRSKDCTLGSKISIKGPQKKIFGVSRGIDESGNLLLEKSNGEIQKIVAGEVLNMPLTECL